MATPTTPADARFSAREKLVLVLLCGAQFMLALDFSILSVALPVIGDELGIATGDLQWIVTAYALPAGGFLLLLGRTADLFGRRKLFLIGMSVFTVASLVAGLATSAELLLAGRVGQGFGAAAVTPAAMSLLTTSFDEGPRRNRAIGINGTLLSLGFLSGVVLGGVITQLIGWRVGLLINVPLGVAAVIAAPKLLSEGNMPESPRLDIPGAITATGGLLGIIYGFTSAERNGWGDAITLGALFGGVALLGLFILIQSRSSHPLVKLGVLGRRNVGWGNVVGLITFSMTTALVFLVTLYLQRVLGLTPLETGLSFGALGGAAVLGGMVAAKVVGALGVRNAMLLGFTLQAAGTGAVYFVGAVDGLVLVLVATAVLGFGHLLAVVTYMITATSGLPDSEQGLATGLTYTAQQVGVAVGTPIVATVVASQFDASTTLADATLAGVRLAVLVDALIVLAAVFVAALLLHCKPAAASGSPAAASDDTADPVSATAG